MKVLQKGALMVIVATLVASVSILLTGNSVADNSNTVNKKSAVTTNLGDVSSQMDLKNKRGNLDGVKNLHSLSPPPPGLFLFLDSKMERVKAPPIRPQKSVEPEFKRSMPHIPVAPVKKSVLMKTVPAAPKRAHAIIGRKPSIKQSPVQPIWTKDKLINTHIAPSSPAAIVPLPVEKRFTKTPPMQRYMYVPIPRYQSSLAPPQMPVQNTYNNLRRPNTSIQPPQIRKSMRKSPILPNSPKLNKGLSE
jgi:hypothetical protein